jgi:carbamoyl-phosphate synthase small subunit
MTHNAILTFADGDVFTGRLVGHSGIVVGEAVFNTAITGYQEIITDPSYHRQLVNFTHPHIGNTGVTPLDDESPQAFVAGIIARRITRHHSNWRAVQSLPGFLCDKRITAIEDIDTRAITRKLRNGGAISASIAPGKSEAVQTEALAAARAFAGLQGVMLASEAGSSRSNTWEEGLWRAAHNDYVGGGGGGKRVVILDCGTKSAILRHLAARGCQLTVMPYESDVAAVLAQRPDGVVFSNGPGDPEPCEAAIKLARALLNQNMPLLGICLGHQILAVALELLLALGVPIQQQER